MASSNPQSWYYTSYDTSVQPIEQYSVSMLIALTSFKLNRLSKNRLRKAAIHSKTSLSVARNSVLFSMRKWATRLIIIYLFPAHNQIAYTLLQLTPTSLHQQFNWSHRPRSILSEFKSVHVMALIQWENSTSPLRQILRHLIRRQAWDVIVTSGVGFHEKAMQQTTEVTEWKQIRLSTSSSGHRKAHVHLPTTATFSC